jgi:hypothetical protein
MIRILTELSESLNELRSDTGMPSYIGLICTASGNRWEAGRPLEALDLQD